MRENKSTSHSHYLSAARDLPLANAKANAVVGCERGNAGDPPSPGFGVAGTPATTVKTKSRHAVKRNGPPLNNAALTERRYSRLLIAADDSRRCLVQFQLGAHLLDLRRLLVDRSSPSRTLL